MYQVIPVKRPKSYGPVCVASELDVTQCMALWGPKIFTGMIPYAIQFFISMVHTNIPKYPLGAATNTPHFRTHSFSEYSLKSMSANRRHLTADERGWRLPIKTKEQ